jgi:hypothetical protein
MLENHFHAAILILVKASGELFFCQSAHGFLPSIGLDEWPSALFVPGLTLDGRCLALGIDDQAPLKTATF